MKALHVAKLNLRAERTFTLLLINMLIVYMYKGVTPLWDAEVRGLDRTQCNLFACRTKKLNYYFVRRPNYLH